MENNLKVAVLTDSVSSNYYFPLWYRYYSQNFKPENLFVITYGGAAADFDGVKLGRIWEQSSYNNDERVEFVFKIVSLLLESYDVVVRVDTDEILVADPRRYSNLRDYINAYSYDYITAQGYDVVQDNKESTLDLKFPVLGTQRRIAYAYDALNKTCILNKPIRWAPGFHFCSEKPQFDNLFLFHLKRADIDIQIDIGKNIAAKSSKERNYEYFLTPRMEIELRNRGTLGMPRLSGWSNFIREDYNKIFLDGIKFTENYKGVYHGAPFRPDAFLVEIPPEFDCKF